MFLLCQMVWLYIENVSHVLLGVKQGGVLSPILFSLHVDDALSKLNETDLGCLRFYGLYIDALMYADDIILMSSSLNLLLALCEQELLGIIMFEIQCFQVLYSANR